MSSPVNCQSSANYAVNTATEDPFISPEFHLRNRSSSSTSQRSETSLEAACCSNAPSCRCRQSNWTWPSLSSLLRILRRHVIPFRWLFIVFCLTTALLIWHLPLPTHELAPRLSEQYSTSVPQVLWSPDPGSRSPDPELWLKENLQATLSRSQKWWKKSAPKPKAAIISLVRNEELEGIMQSMRQLEHHWNNKYEYPWIFFNEKPFSDEFKVYQATPILCP
jgi:alpha 1,2-mannosyltransferase